MAFAEAWVETDPDGSVVTVSVLDDAIRAAKRQIRERLEGDPANSNTGIFSTFGTAPTPKLGSARVHVVTAANLGTITLQDGRIAITSDSKRLYHMAAAGFVEVAYLPSVGGTVTGNLTISRIDAPNGAAITPLSIAAGTDATLGALNLTASMFPSAIGGARYFQMQLGDNAGYREGRLDFGNLKLNVGSGSVVTIGAGGLTVSGGGIALTGDLTMNNGNQVQSSTGGGTFNIIRRIPTTFQVDVGWNIDSSVPAIRTLYTGVSSSLTALQLYLSDGTNPAGLRQVVVGGADSAGTGFRALRIANT